MIYKEDIYKLQNDFDKHWKNKKPWGEDKVIQKEVEKSDRYKKLQAAGVSKADIEKSFQTSVRAATYEVRELPIRLSKQQPVASALPARPARVRQACRLLA